MLPEKFSKLRSKHLLARYTREFLQRNVGWILIVAVCNLRCTFYRPLYLTRAFCFALQMHSANFIFTRASTISKRFFFLLIYVVYVFMLRRYIQFRRLDCFLILYSMLIQDVSQTICSPSAKLKNIELRHPYIAQFTPVAYGCAMPKSYLNYFRKHKVNTTDDNLKSK